MKKSLLFIFIFTIIVFTSCSSNEIKGNKDLFDNIAAEYFKIGEEYFKLGNYKKSIEYFSKIKNMENYSTSVKYKLALCYVKNSEWKNAIDTFNELLKYDPENVSLKSSLAYVYAKDMQFEKASNIYEKIIEKNEYDAIALKNYILVQIAAENTEKVDELKELFRERFPLDDSINKITEDAEKIIESINKKKEEDSKKSADNKNPDEEATAEDTNKLID